MQLFGDAFVISIEIVSGFSFLTKLLHSLRHFELRTELTVVQPHMHYLGYLQKTCQHPSSLTKWSVLITERDSGST